MMLLAKAAALTISASAGFAFLSLGRPAAKPQPAAAARVESVRRLEASLKDPKAITRKDVKAARQAWGKDGERMLELLRRSESATGR